MLRWLVIPLYCGACTGIVIDEGSLPASEPSEDSLLVGQYLFVTKSEDMPECPPGSYALFHNISPLARAIVDGEPFSLENDTLALALLDSMLNGQDTHARRFYFWIVTRSLKRSDGYYSEGVGHWGTEFLFKRPDEFLIAWTYCTYEDEKEKWAWYLAAEEHIVSEGHPAALVITNYRRRLDTATTNLPKALLGAKAALIQDIDSIYHELAKDDRPLDVIDEGN